MLELNKIYNGDCLEVLKDVDDKSIDMVFADLPYGVTDCAWDERIDLGALWINFERILKPRCPVIFTATQPFTTQLISSKPKWFRHEWIWEKNNGSNCFQANRMPMTVHESVLIFGKIGVNYYPQKVVGKKYNIRKNPKPYGHLARGKKDDPLAIRTTRMGTINNGYRYPRSVIKFPRDQKSIHSTQKPVALLEYLIRTYTNPGDTVLDPTSGSGTTAVAAIYSDRKYICIEKDEEYYRKSIDRINNLNLRTY